MMQYINKSALVAEIERELKNINLNYVSVGSHPSDSDTNKNYKTGYQKTFKSYFLSSTPLKLKRWT